jgi:hypothetical protein
MRRRRRDAGLIRADESGLIQSVFFEEEARLGPREWRRCRIRLKRPAEQRLYSLPEIKKMLKAGTAVCDDKDFEKRLHEGIGLFPAKKHSPRPKRSLS